MVNDVDLCIGPKIIIFCRIDKSTVPFHMFVPVKLALYPFLWPAASIRGGGLYAKGLKGPKLR